MKKNLLILLLAFTGTVYGSDSLRIELNTRKFNKGDTLDFKCTIPNFAELKLQRSTLNVWIEDLERTHRWKYRYPIIDGEVSASLAITDKIPDGRYAVNFLVQPGFLKVTGEVVAHDKKDTSIMYMMMLKNKKGTYIDNTPVTAEGGFRLKSTLFLDSAFFVFAPANKAKRNYLAIAIETLLDSAFVPALYETHFISVGDVTALGGKKTDTTHYTFSSEEADKLLPDVTVTTKYKSKVQQFDAEYYSHGLFQNEGAIVFDGIEKKDIARSSTIMQFIVSNVTGLVEDPDGGIFWRQQPVQFYLDEFAVSPEDLVFISPADIAMIKAFRPPAHVGGDFDLVSGAIAVYTKKGTYLNDNKYRHSFIVKGYTNFESKWQ
ncbi:MAG: hypothetical protein V4539_18375 [Bacteroidota bacterium]